MLTDSQDYTIRPLSAADEAVLWEMLFEALPRGENAETMSPEIVRQPKFAKYVEGWGKDDDLGFIAYDANENQALGAVWCRLSLDREAAGASHVPDLAFAVRAGHRRRGIGAALLTNWVRANPEQSAVRLRVAPHSPAVRLYERFGFRVVDESTGAVTMRRDA